MHICAVSEQINPTLRLVLLIGAPILFLLLLPYVRVPFWLRRTFWQEEQPTYAGVELAQLPEEIAFRFQQVAAALVQLGFGAIAHLTQNIAHTKQFFAYSLWVDRNAGHIAQVVAIKTQSSRGGVHFQFYINFRTDFTDGSNIVTSNVVSPGITPDDPSSDSIACPRVQDLKVLYGIHRARVERDRGGRTWSTEAVMDGPDYLRGEHVRSYDYLVRIGYCKLDPQTRRYLLTLGGAFRMTYALLFPMKQIRQFRRWRKTRRTLRELDFNDQALPQEMSSAVTSVDGFTQRR